MTERSERMLMELATAARPVFEAFLKALSLKNGEIVNLKQEAAEEKLAKEKYKTASRMRLFVIITLAASWALFAGFKLYRFFRSIP